jgi:hypothetical protein
MEFKPRRPRRHNRHLHFVNEDGMVACNPRDREAAHRAQVEGIATDIPQAVTCKKCRTILGRRTQELTRPS